MNTGQLPQYFVENSHRPIIPKEVFLQVQAEMARRKKHWQDFRYSHKNALAGRTVCGDCGAHYRKVGDYWRCETKTHKNRHPGVECDNGSISEADLKAAVVEAFDRLPEKSEELIRMDERLRWGGLNKADEMLSAIEAEMSTLEEQGHADSSTAAEQQERLRTLRSRWTEASEQRAVYADKAMQIQSLQDRIRVMAGEKDTPAYKLSPNGACEKAETFYRITRPKYSIVEFSDADVIRFVEKIEVREDMVTVRFKAGISMEIGR